MCSLLVYDYNEITNSFSLLVIIITERKKNTCTLTITDSVDS